jgi:transposase-like protein
MNSVVKRPSTVTICLECQEKGKRQIVRLSRRDTWKASRPHCPACGSTRLEETTKAEEQPKMNAKVLFASEVYYVRKHYDDGKVGLAQSIDGIPTLVVNPSELRPMP